MQTPFQRVDQTTARGGRNKLLWGIGIVIAIVFFAFAIVGMVLLGRGSGNTNNRAETVGEQNSDSDVVSPLTPILRFTSDRGFVAGSCLCPRVVHQPYEQVIPNREGSLCVGGCGGTAFLVHRPTVFVRAISLWMDNDSLSGIRIQLTDGWQDSFGGTEGNQLFFAFRDGERISGDLRIGTNGARRSRDVRVGFLAFQTTDGRSFSAGVEKKDMFSIPVGDRFLSGVYGRSGKGINSLGFVFLRPLTEARFTNVRFPTLTSLRVPPPRTSSMTIVNRASSNTTTTTRFAKTVGSANCWTSTMTNTLNVVTRANSGTLVVPDGLNRWAVTGAVLRLACVNESRTENIPIATLVEPNQQCVVTVTQPVHFLDRVPFTAVLELTFAEGRSITMETSGTYLTLLGLPETVQRVCSPIT